MSASGVVSNGKHGHLNNLQKFVFIKMKFDLDIVQKAANDWGFNCGPAALCAITGLMPEQIRKYLDDFEKKGYTNPSLMNKILKNLGLEFKQIYRSDRELGGLPIIKNGLLRVQWGGPWTKPGVPMRARYRHTHWVAVRKHSFEIFDINAMCVGGWLPESEWSMQLVPWLIKECCPKGDGTWWVTHGIEVESR